MPEATQRFFDAKPEAVRLAREFASRSLALWGRAESVETVRLCVSELASNALVHGTKRGHGFLVRLAVDDDFVRLEVHDSRESRLPQIRHPSALETCGRGLLLVAELADGWGVEEREPVGKVVWVRFKASGR